MLQPCVFKGEYIICIDEQGSAAAAFNDLSFLFVTCTSDIILHVSENLIHNRRSNSFLKGTSFGVFIHRTILWFICVGNLTSWQSQVPSDSALQKWPLNQDKEHNAQPDDNCI